MVLPPRSVDGNPVAGRRLDAHAAGGDAERRVMPLSLLAWGGVVQRARGTGTRVKRSHHARRPDGGYPSWPSASRPLAALSELARDDARIAAGSLIATTDRRTFPS